MVHIILNYIILEHLGYEQINLKGLKIKKSNIEYKPEEFEIIAKDGVEINHLEIPSTYTYKGNNYKITKVDNFGFANIQSLVSIKKAVFVNPKKPVDIYILWKSFNEWEQYLYNAAVNRQSIDKLETLDYIIEDDDNKNEEYYNMDKNLLITILKSLENKGKCGLVKDGNNYIAVKFIR